MPVSAEELMLRFAGGEDSAFAALLERFRPLVLDYAKHIIGDRETAEDITQETFLRVFRARDTYQPSAKFSTWLYRIVTNLCYDEFRKHRRQVSLESMLGSLLAVESHLPQAGLGRRGPAQRPDVQAEEKEMGTLIEDAMETLSQEHREVISLRIHEGLACAEVADRLGCSIGTVKSRMHYALKKLREQLMKRT
jgi:RNA polymerase sigma-70 factor (ECF subfamily)